MGEKHSIILACAADSGYALPLAVMLRSVGMHLGAGWRAEAYVLDDGLSADDRARVLASLPENVGVHWRRAPELAAGLPLWGRMSPTTYQKLTLGQWMPAEIKRALWLDCDMLAQADVGFLWNLETGGAVAMAVQDQRVPLVSSRFGVAAWRELGLAREARHFNAGLLLVDLEAWRELDVLTRSMDYLRRHGERVYFWDQEALNAVLSGRWKELDSCWNWHPGLGHLDEERTGHPAILHFSGNLKPWKFAGENAERVLYRTYLAQTAWANEPLPRARRDALLEWYERSWLRGILYPAEQWAMMAQRSLTRTQFATGKGIPNE